MIKSIFLFISLFFLLLCGCKSDTNKDTTTKSNGIEIEVDTEANSDISYTPLPLLPNEKRKLLFDSINEIDYVFYSLPFSMSQNENGAIKNNLSHIANTPFKGIPSNCAGTAMCREFFKSQGEQIMEADIYFSKDCLFFLFMGDDGKPAYGANMTPAGQVFYQNILKQVSGVRTQK